MGFPLVRRLLAPNAMPLPLDSALLADSAPRMPCFAFHCAMPAGIPDMRYRSPRLSGVPGDAPSLWAMTWRQNGP